MTMLSGCVVAPAPSLSRAGVRRAAATASRASGLSAHRRLHLDRRFLDMERPSSRMGAGALGGAAPGLPLGGPALGARGQPLASATKAVGTRIIRHAAIRRRPRRATKRRVRNRCRATGRSVAISRHPSRRRCRRRAASWITGRRPARTWAAARDYRRKCARLRRRNAVRPASSGMSAAGVGMTGGMAAAGAARTTSAEFSRRRPEPPATGW
jgi:hypothetical protein